MCFHSSHQPILLFLCALVSSTAVSQTLEEELKRSSTKLIVEQALQEGDAARGAIVFFQPTMSCSKCHATEDGQPASLGPPLMKPDPRLINEAIVEAILEPSKSIRAGFEVAQVLTTSGKVLTGLIIERSEAKAVLRDGSGVLLTVEADDIDEFSVLPQSIMPVGQVNQLTSRQQFLDLVRYLIEIRDGGTSRVRELQPSEALLTLKLPEYESHIDHRSLIHDWGQESLKRGEAIYRRVCANCHGTKDQLGSLPTSLRFAEGKFKNGNDPLSMYRTLTRGFGFMPAQSWMVPSQKYDVIHYIREIYLKPQNPSQLSKVDDSYLAGLPAGNTHGPAPSLIEAWSAMDYGASLAHCYETPGESLNIAYKGVAVRLDQGAGGISRGEQWMAFDTDTMRMAAGWRAKQETDRVRFIDWRDIQLNGEHGIHPKIVGDVAFQNPNGPGWADPRTGSFVDDQRVEGRDQRRYGPLPREWAKFHGLYYYGAKVVFGYSVGRAELLEMPRQVTRSDGALPPTYVRTFNIGPRNQELVLQISESSNESIIARVSDGNSVASISTNSLAAGIVPLCQSMTWSDEDGRLCLKIPAGNESLKFSLWMTARKPEQTGESDLSKLMGMVVAALPDSAPNLDTYMQGGPARWAQKLETKIVTTSESGPFAVETLTAPESNPWLAQMRFSGIDFFGDGSIAACTWDGDVWHIQILEDKMTLRWQRIASGLFQPLGLKIVNEKIHLTCRDHLTVLQDLNGDGEIDFYECLNNDHQVTEHFHEFAMGLQIDAEGNFYYAKSGRHALPAVVPHHGTLLRVSRDGSTTEILATGFRAANGVCMNPDGSFIVTDQEGFWNPKNRINWVTIDPHAKPKFYGNMFGYHDITDTADSAMEPPLCWITNKFDRSPAELLWVDSMKWGGLNGGLLNLSYGNGKVFLVLHEEVAGVQQGGMIALPIPAFPTGVMRGRFRPQDQELYLCGMFAWAGDATSPGGIYRLRATGNPIVLPTALQAKESGLYLTFPEAIDPKSIGSEQVKIQTWSLKRSEKYGSDHYNRQELQVRGTSLSADGKTIQIDVDELGPAWCMAIDFDFRTSTGLSAKGIINNTIHHCRPQ